MKHIPFVHPFMALLIAIVFLSLSFTSCSRNEPNTSQRKSSQINLYLQADVLSLDPRVGGERRTVQVLRELFEGLVRIGSKGTELALAQSFSISEDQTKYTFHLRPSKWSNGVDLTAHDFEWSWKGILNHQIATTSAFFLFIIKNAKKAFQNTCSIDDVGVKALDDLTLRITLEHPAPYFLDLLLFPVFFPVCRSAVETHPEWAGRVFPDYVCNGPFLLKDRQIKSHITCEKNPCYWDKDRVEMDQLHFTVIEDPQTAYNMFTEGTLDWYGDTCGAMTLEMVYDLTRKGQLIKRESGGTHFLVCGTQIPHLSSPKIRKALACAINRADICNKLLQGGEKPAYSVVHHTLTKLKNRPFEENPTKAKSLFEEGLKELGYTWQTYPPIVLTYFSDPTVKAVAEIEQQQLQQTLGIRVELQAHDWGTWVKKFNSGNFELMSMVFFTWYPDPIYNLDFLRYKSDSLNNTGWEHPGYIRLLNLSDACTDPQMRDQYLREAENFVMEHMPMIPVYYHTFKYVKGRNIDGEIISASGQMELKGLRRRP